MQVYDYNKYTWNHSIGPNGNMGRICPQIMAELCDKYDIPWYTYGNPNTSGIKVYCEDDELWHKLLNMSKY